MKIEPRDSVTKYTTQLVLIEDLTDNDFDPEGNLARAYGPRGPAFVFFYAGWCSHCHEFAPVFQKLADSIGGVVKMYRADTDAAKRASDALRIHGVPTLMYFNTDTNTRVEYQGQRTYDAILNFVARNV
jgi:thioredoxin-like negative regulator of GroEL